MQVLHFKRLIGERERRDRERRKVEGGRVPKQCPYVIGGRDRDREVKGGGGGGGGGSSQGIVRT